MRNIDKKWTLFVIATVVCFYGICYTLLNYTFAASVIPVDKNFDDINFYQCVVDSYNYTYSLDLSYESKMDYNKLKKLTILKCDDTKTLDRDKIVSVKGIELMTSLEEVSLINTNISDIDLSNNKMIKSLDLTGNVFVNNFYVYNGEEMLMGNGINLVSKLVDNNITWVNSNTNFLDVSFYGKVKTKKNGLASVVGESSLGYKVINNVNVVNIFSSKYVIDNVRDKIYIDDIKNFNVLDIECGSEEISIEVYFNTMELHVKHDENILKKFILIEKDA